MSLEILMRFVWKCNKFNKNRLVANYSNSFYKYSVLFFNTSSKYQNTYEQSNKIYFGRFKYHTDLETEINVQINREQLASQTYLSIASYFGNVNVARHGCQKFFMKMHNEENEHAQEFIKYQLMRGGLVYLQSVPSPCLKETTILEYFEKALNLEMNITGDLENLVKLAEKHQDYQCADFVTSVFLKEQMESINELSNLITIIRNLGCSEINVYLFDLELQKKYS